MCVVQHISWLMNVHVSSASKWSMIKGRQRCLGRWTKGSDRTWGACTMGIERIKDGSRMANTLHGDEEEHMQDGDENDIDESEYHGWTNSRRGVAGTLSGQ